jgi:hypothetical protein
MMGRHKKIEGMWDRIDEVILDSGLTKSEIARRCGFSRNILADRSAGRMLSLGALASFCSTMNVSADYILGIKRTR